MSLGVGLVYGKELVIEVPILKYEGSAV